MNRSLCGTQKGTQKGTHARHWEIMYKITGIQEYMVCALRLEYEFVWGVKWR